MPLKDSGVEWLGQVPEGWEVMPLKSLARMSGGGTPTKDRLEFWDGDIPWVSPKDMKVARVSSSEDNITPLGLASSATSMVPAGSLLVVFRSGILRHTLPVAINDVPVTLNQDMKAVQFMTLTPLLTTYFYWVYCGRGADLLPIISKMGATVESIDSALFMGLMVPLPPLQDQQAIAAYLDVQITKLHALREKLELSVTKLREYRTSLISAAVTGKIDVRGEVALPAREAL